jgi:sterol desaturase/sphingolipid hydroxylase (fatty acid hydroxylase superfamily)
MAKPYKSVRIFKSDRMEKLTHVHPLIPLILWGPFVLFFLYRATENLNLLVVGSVFAFGVLSWTLTEYLMHRFVFHFHPEGKIQERIQFLIHGIHHLDPVDPTRLVMPPIMSISFGIMLFLIFRSFLGAVYIDPFFSGFLLGYLGYDYIHYSVHHFQPRTRFGKQLKQSHMQHHFMTHNARWGVSSPLWDHVFGTLEPSLNSKDHLRHGS